jgi:hypothetical protein
MLKLDERQIPQGDTIDIMAELATIKDEVSSPSSVPKRRGEVCLMLMWQRTTVNGTRCRARDWSTLKFRQSDAKDMRYLQLEVRLRSQHTINLSSW